MQITQIDNKRLKILIIGFWGHAEYVVSFASALAKNAKVMLFAENNSKQFVRFLNNLKVNFYDVRTHNLLELLRQIKSILYYKKEFAPDITLFIGPYLWSIPALIFAKHPICTIFHDVNLHPGEITWWRELILRLFANKSDYYIVHGENLKKQLLKKYNLAENHIQIMLHGELSLYKKLKFVKVKEEPHTILFFGRIREYKGLKYLIDAIPTIRKSIPDLKVIIAGEGETDINKDILSSDAIELYNFRIPTEMANKFFQRASAVILPYTEASQSGVIPLAYAFNKPVIATAVGSIPDVVKHGKTGFLIQPKNSKYLAKAVIKLLKNKNLSEKMAKECKTMSLALGWDRQISNIMPFFNKIVSDVK